MVTLKQEVERERDNSTHRLPWIPLRMSLPFFIAFIVSMFMFAFSIALTWMRHSEGDRWGASVSGWPPLTGDSRERRHGMAHIE